MSNTGNTLVMAQAGMSGAFAVATSSTFPFVPELRRREEVRVAPAPVERDEAILRARLGHFFVLVALLQVFQNLMGAAFDEIVAVVPVYVFSLVGLGLSTLAAAIATPKIMGRPLRSFGLNLHRGAIGAAEGALAGLVIVLAVAHAQPDLPIVTTVLEFATSPFAAAYMVSVVLQELVFRGMFVTCLEELLSDRRGLVSVGLASVVFASMHLPFGWTITALTLVAGWGFGLLYRRQRSLVGVCVAHFILGCLATAVGLI
ncbi:MAG: type II CAAX endopeptidase family protein [Myxococcota bacterium]